MCACSEPPRGQRAVHGPGVEEGRCCCQDDICALLVSQPAHKGKQGHIGVHCQAMLLLEPGLGSSLALLHGGGCVLCPWAQVSVSAGIPLINIEPIHDAPAHQCLLVGLCHVKHCERRKMLLQVYEAAVQGRLSCPHLTAVPARMLCSP